MKKRYLLLVFSTLVVSCSFSPSDQGSTNSVSVQDLFATVYSSVTPTITNLNNATYTLSTTGEGIRIDDGTKIVPIKADTTNEVTLTTSDNRKATFKVTVKNRTYTSTHSNAESSEGWFNDVTIDPVTNMTSSFVNGMDISSCKELYDNGQKFYNADGVEESLFYILKDNDINYIRLRLWNDPKDTYTDSSGNEVTYYYGGGNCDLEHVSWMAHEAKAAGLKVLLDYHFSDFWTDPSNQVIPKAWKDVSTVDGLATKVKDYVKSTLTTLKENDALPDMVQIGNETSTGLMIHNPGGTTTSLQGNTGCCLYHDDHTERNNGTQARYYSDSTKNGNLKTYIQAAIDGINAVDSNIDKMVHFVKGFSDPDTSIAFFKNFEDMDIDVYGLSAYSYYHFGNISTLKTGLTKISEAFPDKKICIAETSYGFTYEKDSNCQNTFSSSSDTCKPVSGYAATTQGQAKMIRDMSEVVANLDNGLGMFYWEGAWTPTKYCGWADKSSSASWANQALFSYNGKALGSLKVYSKMLNK